MKFWYVIVGVICFLIWHGFCHFYNLYFLVWWTDIVAHFIAGATAGLLWWWFMERTKLNAPSKMNSVSIATFATTISVFWEFWEFSNWRYAFLRNSIGKIQQQYYPYWGNNLGDIFWGLVGGSVVAAIYIFIIIKRKKLRSNQ